MPVMPKRVKFRKMHRGRRRGIATSRNKIEFGEYAIKSLDRGWLTAPQIEAARVALSRHVKRGGKIWVRVFPDKPYTKKPAETRMGKGKGEPEYYVAVIKPGSVLFEMEGIPEELARSALRLCAHKIPFRAKFIRRVGVDHG